MTEGFSFNRIEEVELKEPLILPKADFLERFIAKFIDFLIVGAFFAFPTFIGELAGLTYILISDGLKGGQSIGKRIIGLKTVSALGPETECSFKQSIMRNSVFGVLLLWYFIIGWIPYAGKPLTILLWVAAFAIETALIYVDDRGARFGDRVAGTQVVPARVKTRAE